jgi:hypothetical protein
MALLILAGDIEFYALEKVFFNSVPYVVVRSVFGFHM